MDVDESGRLLPCISFEPVMIEVPASPLAKVVVIPGPSNPTGVETGVCQSRLSTDTLTMNKQVPVAEKGEAFDLRGDDGNKFLRSLAAPAAAANQVGQTAVPLDLLSLVSSSPTLIFTQPLMITGY